MKWVSRHAREKIFPHLAFHSLLTQSPAVLSLKTMLAAGWESGERRNLLSKHLKRVRGWNVNFDGSECGSEFKGENSCCPLHRHFSLLKLNQHFAPTLLLRGECARARIVVCKELSIILNSTIELSTEPNIYLLFQQFELSAIISKSKIVALQKMSPHFL